ncbi:MAG: fused MFS/spermidine synthase [Pseudomonadota bacterium]|nr:fused MFS/spermidine synthase [Pseudomonadota bacterium]
MASAAISMGNAGGLVKLRFMLAIFLGSFLLFLVQPMVARMALPRLGGAPAVWNSAMLVYQLLLLGGYAYAHWLGRFAPRTQGAIQVVLLIAAAAMLPIGLVGGNPSPDANIFLWVPWLLLVSIGPLFLAISAQAPLLQRWFAISGQGDPYPLYAASNLGSFAGLIAYPLVVEPLLPVAVQSGAWSIGYGAVLVLVASCALALPKVEAPERHLARTPPPAAREVALWIILAAIPSALILSTTLFITTDIVAMPLLWVVPLGLYLLSFSVAFATDRRPARWISVLAPFALLTAAAALFMPARWWMLVIGASIFSLFAVSVALHSRLFDRRPDPEHLTAFYLYLAVGGALGGIFAALLAPMLFDWTYEHPLLMLAAALALPATSPIRRVVNLWNGSETAHRVTLWGIPVVLLVSLIGEGAFGLPASARLAFLASCLLFAVGIFAIGNRILFAAAVAGLMLGMGGWGKLALSAQPGKMSRSFFGIYSIGSRQGGEARVLVHGTTIHGIQLQGSPLRERSATTYYAAPSGIGMALSAAPSMFGNDARIDVVGLGTGTVACYAQPGQRWTFYEIDPAVVEIARDPRRFTFLSRCLPNAPVLIGDARLTLEDAEPASTDLLVVDAFSSDSIPMHLVTLEAFQTYRRKLSANGLLLVHISNRHLDLKPVVAAAAREGWTARLRFYAPTAEDIDHNQHTASIWVALSPTPATIGRLEAANPGAWQKLEGRSGFRPWTDDYASVLPVLRSLQ